MKKGIIVVGIQGSGKSTKIRDLVGKTPRNQLLWIEPIKSDSQIKKLIKSDTTTVVIEGVVSKNEMARIQNYVREGFLVSDKGKNATTIYPKIIASTCNLILSDLVDFEHDFEIIKLKDRF